jgi:hypothetical protein
MLISIPTCSENTKLYEKIRVCTLEIQKVSMESLLFDVFHVLPSLSYTLSLNFKIPHANHLNNNYLIKHLVLIK